MSGFESDSFRKTYPNQNKQQMKEFNVGLPEDEEIFPQDEEAIKQQFAAARKEKSVNMGRITDPAKKRIEYLANIGRLFKDVQIGSSIFSLRTLKAKEAREASMATFNGEVGTQLEASFLARKHQLARSIFKIDGQELGLVIGSDDIESVLSFIEELEEAVIDKLFSEFLVLKQEAKDQFLPKSEADVQEVAEDLKK